LELGVSDTISFNFCFLVPEMRESDLNSLSVSQDKQFVAIADNLGRPRIYNYPAYMAKQAYSVLEGHTSNVISCAFTQEDSYLITLGENDCSLMVWAYKAARHEVDGSGSPVNLTLGDVKHLRDADVNEDLEKVGKNSGKKPREEEENLLE
jgi:WD40 repeat protein